MPTRARLLDSLAVSPIVGVLRRCPPKRTVETVHAAVGAGLRAVEVTMESEDATRQLEALARALPEEIALGAGTVMTVAEVDLAVDAGATFVVSPAFDAAVVGHALDRDADAVPGVLSPTEIIAASRAGATMCKLFPAGPLGVDYLRVLRGPFPHVPFLCTGGIDATNAASFLEAGAVGAGIGSEIFDSSAIERGDTAAVAAAVSAVLTATTRPAT